MKRKLVLTLSGGLDSTVMLHMSLKGGYSEIHTISFDYGQRHIRELNCVTAQISSATSKFSGIITNKVIDVRYIKDIANTSSLTNLKIDNPDIKNMAGDAQPISYVPFRNNMFVSIAAAYAESLAADEIWYGSAQADSLAGYWDSSIEWVGWMNSILSLNRKTKIELLTPLINMSKKEITLKGIELGVNFNNTWTCYSNRDDGLADATTPSSSLRLRGFIESGYRDPIQYIQQDKLNKIYDENKCVHVPIP